MSNNISKTQDLKLVAERIIRMLKNGGAGSEIFTRDVTTLAEAFENIEEIIFDKENL